MDQADALIEHQGALVPRKWLRAIETIAQGADRGSVVLIRGEAGTGKDVVARMLHTASGRGRELFVKVNCAARPADRLAIRLFGHERDAWAGAGRQKLGAVEFAIAARCSWMTSGLSATTAFADAPRPARRGHRAPRGRDRAPSTCGSFSRPANPWLVPATGSAPGRVRPLSEWSTCNYRRCAHAKDTSRRARSSSSTASTLGTTRTSASPRRSWHCWETTPGPAMFGNWKRSFATSSGVPRRGRRFAPSAYSSSA